MPIERSAGRTRTDASNPTAAAQNGAGRLGAARGFLTGADARAKSERVLSEQAQAIEVRAHGLDLDSINRYRFRMQEGEEADIIILDVSLDAALFADEHHMKDADGRWTIFEFCPKEYDHCPLCETNGIGGSSYTMFLTILDLRGYTDRRQVFHPHQKRLMAVRSNLHPEFFKLHDAAMQQYQTMRGMQLLMARDGTINSAIGHPTMLASGAMFNMVSEEDLVAEFGHAEVRDPDRENALVKAENFDITPFAYTRVFVPPTGADLRKKYGAGSAPSGSRDDIAGDWNQRETQANQGGGRMRSRTGIPPADDGASGSGFNRTASPGQANTAAHSGPVAPGAGGPLPARTRTRSAAPPATTGGGAVQPGAPAATRQRTRSAAPTPPIDPDPAPTPPPANIQARPRARVQRSASPPPGGPRGNVPNDLDDAIPF